MRVIIGAMGLAAVVALCSRVQADPWKDESGHGRGGPPPWAGRGGEPPDWARGKGVWDGMGAAVHRRGRGLAATTTASGTTIIDGRITAASAAITNPGSTAGTTGTISGTAMSGIGTGGDGGGSR